MFKGVSVRPSLYELSDHHGLYGGAAAAAEEVFGSDEFRMYEYKIKRCPRTRSHDWTECPYAHRGEKAQRRDPRRHAYAAVVCPSFRAGASCERGEACEFAHGVFEYWLHPTRYRTRACNSGRLCQRKVCFFAHSPDQLRRPGPSAARLLLRRGAHHLAYRARARASSPSPPGLGNRNASAAAEDESFEKFAEFLRSLRALKIGGDGEASRPGLVAMSSGLDVSTEADLDLTHIDWVSELVK